MMPRTNDMRQVYGKARLVLAPSQWEEADAPVGDWVGAVRSVWFDDDLCASLGAEASRHSTRPDLDPKFQIEQIEAILETAIKAHRK